MNDKKIAVIISITDDEIAEPLIKSLEEITIPEKFSLEVRQLRPVNGWQYGAYDLAMRASDAKYKIYLNERVVVTNKNFLAELIKIFRADKKIGIVGVSGAIELSTHGISLSSAKRTDENYSGAVEVVDSFFMATQYDLPWRTDFKDNYFGGQAQCVEFKRAGYKIFVAAQGEPWIKFDSKNLKLSEKNRQKFLNEYSADLFPLVTVIIPTFNRPKYFREALESALAQTYRNIEVVISDNSTEDDTEILMHDYHDPRIKYFHHKNFNAHDNWNFARKYNNPAAEYVNWLLDDDLFYPAKLEKMIEIYRNNPDVSLVTSAKNYINADGKVTNNTQNLFKKNIKFSGDKAGRLLFFWDNFIGEPTTVLIRKKYLRGGDLCWHDDEQGFFSLVDVSTWLQLLSKGNMIRLIECLSAFRVHNQQATYWNSTYALTPVSWVKLLKSAWDKKIFIRNEREYRIAALRLLPSCANRLKEFCEKNVRTKEVETLEKTFFALVHSLENGCKLELPPVEYSAQDEIKKIH